MDLQTELNYAADVDAVFTMLCNEDFRRQVCEANRARDFDVSTSPDGTGARVRVRRLLPAPEVARRFVGDTIEVVQVETWGAPAAGGSRSADLRVDIPGKPASMRGTIALSPTGTGTTQSVSGDITVQIPLVGAKLEREVRRALVAALEQEGRVGARWLAG